MKTNHTPGPWHCYQPKDSPRQITDGQMRICTMTNRSEEIANARLIAAAPELLAVAQEALTDYAGCRLERFTAAETAKMQRLQAAVSKAQGNP